MNCNFLSENLLSYFENLSAKTPVPGGGSVVAVVGSISCCLLDMVINFTIGKEKYKKYEKQFLDIKEKNQTFKKDLFSFIEEDSKIYLEISKNSKDKEKQKVFLEKSIQLHKKICEYMVEVVNFSDFAARYGSKYLISDAGIVAVLAVSAFKGARINILINYSYLGDLQKKYKAIVEELENKEREIELKGKMVYQYTIERMEG